MPGWIDIGIFPPSIDVGIGKKPMEINWTIVGIVVIIIFFILTREN